MEAAVEREEVAVVDEHVRRGSGLDAADELDPVRDPRVARDGDEVLVDRPGNDELGGHAGGAHQVVEQRLVGRVPVVGDDDRSLARLAVLGAQHGERDRAEDGKVGGDGDDGVVARRPVRRPRMPSPRRAGRARRRCPSCWIVHVGAEPTGQLMERSRPSQYGLRRSFFRILPEGLRGRASMKSTDVGHL